MEGNGKFYFDDGEYYIGQFLNGLRHGNGTLYYRNGNVQYEGEFINDKAEGDGRFIDEEGNQYIGKFLDGKRNGEGIIIDKNGYVVKNKKFSDKELENKNCMIF